MLANGGGRVVNISVNESTMRRAGFVPYGPSRAGSEALSRVMAAELRGHRGHGQPAAAGRRDPYRDAARDDVPPGREVLDPSVMGPPIVWLASTRRPACTTSGSSPSSSSSGCASGTRVEAMRPDPRSELRPWVSAVWWSHGATVAEEVLPAGRAHLVLGGRRRNGRAVRTLVAAPDGPAVAGQAVHRGGVPSRRAAAVLRHARRRAGRPWALVSWRRRGGSAWMVRERRRVGPSWRGTRPSVSPTGS